jgi:hypothetical protein
LVTFADLVERPAVDGDDPAHVERVGLRAKVRAFRSLAPLQLDAAVEYEMRASAKRRERGETLFRGEKRPRKCLKF